MRFINKILKRIFNSELYYKYLIMGNSIVLAVTFFIAVAALLNGQKTKRRLDALEIVLAKKNLLTWDDPAWKLNKDDKELLKELNK